MSTYTPPGLPHTNHSGIKKQKRKQSVNGVNIRPPPGQTLELGRERCFRDLGTGRGLSLASFPHPMGLSLHKQGNALKSWFPSLAVQGNPQGNLASPRLPMLPKQACACMSVRLSQLWELLGSSSNLTSAGEQTTGLGLAGPDGQAAAVPSPSPAKLPGGLQDASGCRSGLRQPPEHVWAQI